MVFAYKYRVLIDDWLQTPMWEIPSYLTYNHSVSVLRKLAAKTPDKFPIVCLHNTMVALVVFLKYWAQTRKQE